MKSNRYLLVSALAAGLGGFLFGFDTAVISGATAALRAAFHLTSGELGFTVASALIGTIIGSLAVGLPVERFGRKPVLLALAVFYAVSALGCAFAWSWASLVLFRLISGLAIGGASVVSPMYIAEISPPEKRGRLVGINQLNVVIGILAAYTSNYLIARFTPGGEAFAWRWMLGIVALPSLLFLIILLPIPESPRWLVMRRRDEEAFTVLTKLGVADAQEIVLDIADSLDEERAAGDERFFQRKYTLPILVAILIATFNQLTGINAVLYYAADIFRAAGAAQASALAQSVIVGLTNLFFTLVAMTVIDRLGRRKLLLIGAVGLAVCLSLVAFAFAHDLGGGLVLGSLIGYIAFFAFSQGAVIWVYLSEIFPNRIRARGQALGTFTHWVWCAAVSWGFPVIADWSKAGPFVVFAVMMAVQFVVVWKFFPETKGVSLEQIQRQLRID